MTATSRAFKSRIEQEDLYSIPIDEFFKSAFSVDCVIFGYHERQLKVLLIERGTEPFDGFWALPGDLVYPLEDLDGAASRVLNDLTSINDIPIRQVKTFGKVDRHPLGRVITVGYTAIVEMTDIEPNLPLLSFKISMKPFWKSNSTKETLERKLLKCPS